MLFILVFEKKSIAEKPAFDFTKNKPIPFVEKVLSCMKLPLDVIKSVPITLPL